jgi:hypothetical protein
MPKAISAVRDSLALAAAEIDSNIWYKEILADSSIKSNFRIIFEEFTLYFDSKKVSAYCDEIIALNDSRKSQYINLKQEVNNQTHKLYVTNDAILMSTFPAKIVNNRTKRVEKSLLTKFYRNPEALDKWVFFVITSHRDTINLNRLSDSK